MQRQILFLAVLALLCGVIGPRSSVLADQNQLIWSEIEGIPSFVDLNDVYLVDAEHAWAVGQQESGFGVVFRLTLQNGRWVAALEHVGKWPFRAVVAISARDIWLLRDFGLLMHYRLDAGDNAWQIVEPPAVIELRDFQMFGAGERGIAVGTSPATGYPDAKQELLVLRYEDGAFVQEASVAGRGIFEAIHVAPDGGWAVGNEIWRFHNNTWRKEPSPDPCLGNACRYNLSGVRALNSNEAWAVGSHTAICEMCAAQPIILQRNDNGWRVHTLARELMPAVGGHLHDVSFTDGLGIIVGEGSNVRGSAQTYPMLLSYRNGVWQSEAIPSTSGSLHAVSQLDATHALAVGADGLILSYGYGVQSIKRPVERVPNPNDPAVLYFEETGHTLRGRFRSYWERNGGLPVFGFPLTEEFSEQNNVNQQMYDVQYFERQRFEYHPENAGTPFDILLGHLGIETLMDQGRDWTKFPKADPNSAHYFPETGQAIAPEFWEYWSSHGLDLGEPNTTQSESIALFGFPISPAMVEQNSSSDFVLTQWFERARFEYHPNNPAPFKVLLGRLAAEELAR